MTPLIMSWLRLLAFIASVFGRAIVLGILTTVALTAILVEYHLYRPTNLAAWLLLSAFPAAVLSPLIAAIAGSAWARLAMFAGTASAAAVIIWTLVTPSPLWLACAALLTLETAFFWAASWPTIPVAATATRLTRPRVHAALAAALFSGLSFGVWYGINHAESDGDGIPRAVTNALYFALPMFLAFASFRLPMVSRLSDGLARPFLRGLRDTVRQPTARNALMGLVVAFFITLAVVVALIRVDAPRHIGEDLEIFARDSTVAFGAALVGGVLLAALNGHPHRNAFIVPYAATGAVGCLLWLRFGEAWDAPLIGLGIALGACIGPLLNLYQIWTTPRHIGVAAGLLVGGWAVAALVLAGVIMSLGDHAESVRGALLMLLISLGAIATIGAWYAFFRPALEGTLEILFLPVYRIRAVGPGAKQMPLRGPYLVIANHAAWFDPLWLAKVVPAPITPMMTSGFYDLPVISWLMRNVFGTIRVPDMSFKREAPELQEAIAALDRGECVVIFPEGYLRRKEVLPLRRFGRGIWHILTARPNTPIVACWIEGGWGSYISHRGGLPTKNKKIDFWRRIDIGVLEPLTVDAAALADHMATRTFLMQQVSAARAPLGLAPLTAPPSAEGEAE